MQRYSDYAPTQFDTKGLALSDKQDWFVAPVSITRDTPKGIHTANFESVQEILNQADIDYEVHCFNHWGPGWFEIILVDPKGETILENIEKALADYPILDEDKMSMHETDEEEQTWTSCVCADFQRDLAKAFLDNDNIECEEIVETMPEDKLYEVLCIGMQRANRYWEHSNEGARIDLVSIIDTIGFVDVTQ